ncbi:GlxA family transcriptional regulator [Pseudohalocynthiibacter aestuariivivens]|nr:GlxA family transcriptional regulator [Pseudohalocynthiibacter aestuariivivens]QIE45015.1 GlxA family transcriptional regulator [Pseudohalocynthiibacter aestuariivivens]
MASQINQTNQTGRIVCVLVPRFNMMSLISLLEPARIANYLSRHPLYAIEYCSVGAATTTASNGMPVACAELPDKLAREDLVIVVGSWGAEHYDNPRFMSWLRRQERAGARLCAVELGPYIFARAGLLTHRRATVHWSYLAGFQELYPDVQGAEQLFTIDGRIMTCAGSTGGLDLMLDLIRSDHGNALISEISDNIMHHPVREDTDPQRRPLGRGLEGVSPPVRAAIKLMEAHIDEPLSIPAIAKSVGLSQRQLERQFNHAMGCSAVQFSRLMRLQHARVLLISTDLGIREVAAASGFNSLSHFAFAFRNCFGKRPSDYRQAWPEQSEGPVWPGTLARYLETLRPRR